MIRCTAVPGISRGKAVRKADVIAPPINSRCSFSKTSERYRSTQSHASAGLCTDRCRVQAQEPEL